MSVREIPLADVVGTVNRLSRSPVVSIAPLPVRGRNNRLYRAETAEGALAVKAYPPGGTDQRDRLGAEFGAMEFIHRHAPAAPTPKALARDDATGIALYEWIEGTPLEGAKPEDIAQALDFLCLLHRLRRQPGSGTLPMASEACLSTREIVRQILVRREKMEEAAQRHEKLATWLVRSFDPQMVSILAQVEAIHAAEDTPSDRVLAGIWWTLSPSDFGFHNALRQADGTLAFLDFEYFGWDDPAKLIADMCLHPGMELSPELQYLLLRKAFELYEEDTDFHRRVVRQYPLYALRWCLILLNEFLPQGEEARRFSGYAGEIDALRDHQLGKATQKLNQASLLMEKRHDH